MIGSHISIKLMVNLSDYDYLKFFPPYSSCFSDSFSHFNALEERQRVHFIGDDREAIHLVYSQSLLNNFAVYQCYMLGHPVFQKAQG